MVGEEAIGEAVTGGMLARAAEPDSGGHGGTDGHGACLNCGTELAGTYCHGCGQPAHIHRTVAAWWHDLAHGVLHFEGKIWRTLPMLAWHPGALTRRYIEGERARFVSPLALFLFSVFLMFAIFSALGVNAIGVDGERMTGDVAAEMERAERGVSELERQRAAAVAGRRPTAEIDARLATARRQRDGLADARTLFDGRRTVRMNTGWERLDKGMEKASRNPALLFYKLQSNAYKFGWALIPISLPFVWMLFLHRRRYRERYKAYDHLVFVTYSIAFMSLALIVAILLARIGLSGGIVGIATLLLPPVHIYRQLRGAYELSRWSALWRTFALTAFASIAIGLFFVLLLALGVLA